MQGREPTLCQPMPPPPFMHLPFPPAMPMPLPPISQNMPAQPMGPMGLADQNVQGMSVLGNMGPEDQAIPGQPVPTPGHVGPVPPNMPGQSMNPSMSDNTMGESMAIKITVKSAASSGKSFFLLLWILKRTYICKYFY